MFKKTNVIKSISKIRLKSHLKSINNKELN